MIIFETFNETGEDTVYAVGYIWNKTRVVVKTFATYFEAKKELHYLNGGSDDTLDDIRGVLFKKLNRS